MAILNKKRRNSSIEQRLYLDQSKEITKYQVERERTQKKQMATEKKNIMIDKKLADGLL